VLTVFVSKLTMNRKNHSSSFKSTATFSSSGSYPKNNTSYTSGDLQRAVELQTCLEAKEKEIQALKKGNDGSYYQNKYETLYHENQLLKNELFQLRNLVERKNVPSSSLFVQKKTTSSSSDSYSSTDEKNIKS